MLHLHISYMYEALNKNYTLHFVIEIIKISYAMFDISLLLLLEFILIDKNIFNFLHFYIRSCI